MWQRRNRERRKEITNRGLLTKVLFQKKFKPEAQTGDWTDAEQVMQIHKLLKDLFTRSMEKRNVQYGSIIGRNRNKNPEEVSQENSLDGYQGRKKSLELQQELQALRRKRNQNQREPGSHTSHREILADGRAQSDSGTPRQGRRRFIFPTTIQQFQA
ncbi:hypothetical protein O181_002624 [Austropuccinia psidii MF-1]|uniref:Uncharacterized protein n=1 Tax=Austropuccinia psidii MF-1 TaxID=1389203 RepID=A0A9Q3GD14_9BASI|nr:hypothetical protein [Austropuccinia psidii MF-1]